MRVSARHEDLRWHKGNLAWHNAHEEDLEYNLMKLEDYMKNQ